MKKALLYAFMVVLFWSTVATAFKLTLRQIDVLSLLLVASYVSTIVFFLANPRINYSGNEILKSAFLGFLNPFLYYITLFSAYTLLPAQQAQIINYAWPVVFILLALPLLSQKVSKQAILGILISFSGVIIVSTQGKLSSITNPEGIFFAFLSTFIWAIYWIFNLRQKSDNMFLNFAFGSIYISITAIIFGVSYSLQGLAGSVYVGLFEMGFAYLLWFKALSLAPNKAVIVDMVYIVPFASLFIIHFVLKEPIFPSSFTGLVLVVAGLLLASNRISGKLINLKN